MDSSFTEYTHFLEYKKINSFANYIKGKTVIVVGPSSNLIGLGLGNSFDNDYDVVVKTNGMVFVRNENKKDFGCKIDVLYVNAEFVRTYDIHNILKTNNDIKFCCFKTAKGINLSDLSVPSRPISKFNDINHFQSAPLMGSLVLYDILNSHPKSLHITGFDFYSLDKFYVNGYREQNVTNTNKFAVTNMKNYTGGIHNISDDFLYFYNKFNGNEGLITVDFFIQNLFDQYRIFAKP